MQNYYPTPPALTERNINKLIEADTLGVAPLQTMRLASGYVRKDLKHGKWMIGQTVRVSDELWKYVKEQTIYNDPSVLYLEIIQISGTNTYRLFAKYEFIIGSRLLAVLHSKSAKRFIMDRERKH